MQFLIKGQSTMQMFVAALGQIKKSDVEDL